MLLDGDGQVVASVEQDLKTVGETYSRLLKVGHVSMGRGGCKEEERDWGKRTIKGHK